MKNKIKLTLGLIVLAFAITGCDSGLGGNSGTNQHDAKTTKIVVDGTIKLQEMEDKKQCKMLRYTKIKLMCNLSQ